LNRGITGAIVGRQPFGGFRMSGVGSKAGGPDYML
jgi:RHH-type proline utilization regulon transcriptional repressor/proline dehydrogenase/delta 1-pyrroline-5-carboxylate dehydrogenase